MQMEMPDDDTQTLDFSRINAIVVEDNAGGMAILGVIMRYLGIKAVINTTGQGVVDMALKMKPYPDLILLDINLPETNGYEVLKEIRATPQLQDVLVVAVTAQDADTEIPKCQAAGFNGYIGKPISRTRFPKQIARILQGEAVWETY